MSHLQKSPEPVHSEDKVMLILSYLGLLSLIPFFLTKNEYVKWHAKQGLTLCIVAAVAGIVVQILATVLVKILAILATLLLSVYGLGVLVLMIMGIIKALGGIRWPIPIVSGLAAKLFK
jgi:uncharacterized membrane protein